MFVYFIFYDDFDIYDVENDHQNVITIRNNRRSGSRLDSYVDAYANPDPHELTRLYKNINNQSSDNDDDAINESITRITNTDVRAERDICTLCLEYIYVPHKNLKYISHKIPDNKDKFVFRDLTKYNYDNNEYTHSCQCRPCLHCVCFIDLYDKQDLCIICKKEITWKYTYIQEIKLKTYDFIWKYLFRGLHLCLNIGFLIYILIVIYNNNNPSSNSLGQDHDDLDDPNSNN